MRVVRDVVSLREDQGPWVVALGNFDGVHLSHLAILSRLVELIRETGAVAVVGDAADGRVGLTLGCLRQRVELLSKAKVDVLWLGRSLIRAPRSTLEAMVAALQEDTRVLSVVVGTEDERAIAPLLGARRVPLETVPPVVVNGVTVTSEAIRTCLVEGSLARVEQLLGRCYAVCGRVVHGFHRGRPLGFPTANVRVRNLALPPNGVYAVRFRSGNQVYNGVANLGLKPTFADVERSLETHIFDFDGDLYGCHAEVAFVARLRDERKFPSVQALAEQIRIDCAEARRWLT